MAIVITIIITFTSDLGGILYLNRGTVSACRASTLHCASIPLVRFLLLIVQVLSMLQVPPY